MHPVQATLERTGLTAPARQRSLAAAGGARHDAAIAFSGSAAAYHLAMQRLTALKARARRLKAETFALYLAARHPATPWYAKLLVALLVAYALSPIDLIPDFIPVLGYVDDLILLPLGIALAIRLIPSAVLDACRARAAARLQDPPPRSRAAAAVIILIWLVAGVLCALWAFEAWSP